ncbi:MAG: hypothetical protein M3Z21_14800 [Pseudomonadota bacterium]|nr:hypothetical protein [Pseudomonadota bacterium]
MFRFVSPHGPETGGEDLVVRRSETGALAARLQERWRADVHSALHPWPLFDHLMRAFGGVVDRTRIAQRLRARCTPGPEGA